MNGDIVLVTSIAPKEIENQQRAVASWTENGFRMISCNIKEEIELLAGSFPDVQFVPVHRDSRKINGKPCPYIYDMLCALRGTGAEVGGIINADIHLRHFSGEMYDYLYRQAAENLVFLRRQEVLGVEEEEETEGSVFFGGIDTFLFPTAVTDLVQDDGLILGQAMWDYWFPIVLEKKGIRILEVVNPITFHITHATRWDDSLTEGIADRICKRHFPEIAREDAVEYLKERFFSIISSPQNQICFVPEHLKKKSILVCGEKLDEENRKRLSASMLRVVFQRGDTDKEQFDYVVEIPYNTVVSRVFVEAVVWIMEMRRFEKMLVPVYWRGKHSFDVGVENCNVLLRRKFNQDIRPVTVYRRQPRRNSREIAAVICPVCIATVLIEDDEKVIWDREKTEGKVLIFPAGFIARKWVKRYRAVAEEIELIGWGDNNPDLHDTYIYGLKVYRAEDIQKKQDAYDKIFIISNLYAEEIYKNLNTCIPAEKLMIWNEYDGKKWRNLQEE